MRRRDRGSRGSTCRTTRVSRVVHCIKLSLARFSQEGRRDRERRRRVRASGVRPFAPAKRAQRDVSLGLPCLSERRGARAKSQDLHHPTLPFSSTHRRARSPKHTKKSPGHPQQLFRHASALYHRALCTSRCCLARSGPRAHWRLTPRPSRAPRPPGRSSPPRHVGDSRPRRTGLRLSSLRESIGSCL